MFGDRDVISPEHQGTIDLIANIDYEMSTPERLIPEGLSPDAEILPVFGNGNLYVRDFDIKKFQTSVRKLLFPDTLKADEPEATD